MKMSRVSLQRCCKSCFRQPHAAWKAHLYCFACSKGMSTTTFATPLPRERQQPIGQVIWNNNNHDFWHLTIGSSRLKCRKLRKTRCFENFEFGNVNVTSWGILKEKCCKRLAWRPEPPCNGKHENAIIELCLQIERATRSGGYNNNYT